ncbi:MAG: phosphate:Na+ symporter [Granulosicoccus sp.]
MDFLLLLINIGAAATLLLWAVRMVRTGFERANGNAFRRAIQRSNSNRFKAAGVGMFVAMLLQSSTAVAVLASGFAASGALSFIPGMALLLGADVGSALVVQILTFDLSWLMPVLLLMGGLLFLKGRTGLVRQVGRIILGVGMILLSLKLIGEATVPLRESELLVVVMGYLANDLVASFLVGICVTWLLHSSVASVLLVAALVGQQVVPLAVGAALILGANMGSGLIAFGLTRGQTAIGRRIPAGNLIFRSIGGVLVLITLRIVELPVPTSPAEAMSWMVLGHLAFNGALLVICLPLVGIMKWVTSRLIPTLADVGKHLDPLMNRHTALDRSVLEMPQLALASATRECLRMSDIIELMLQPIMSFYDRAEKSAMQETKDLDLHINRLHSAIKLYLSDLDDTTMTEQDANRKLALSNFAINMEAVGDLVAKNMLKLADQKNRESLTFSPPGWDELTELHKQVVANMHLALNVLVSGDISSARQLVEEKDRIRAQERNSNDQHLRRLQTGSVVSIETSDIHLETLRALRQINSLFAAGAYPILSQHGELLESRLAKVRIK